MKKKSPLEYPLPEVTITVLLNFPPLKVKSADAPYTFGPNPFTVNNGTFEYNPSEYPIPTLVVVIPDIFPPDLSINP